MLQRFLDTTLDDAIKISNIFMWTMLVCVYMVDYADPEPVRVRWSAAYEFLTEPVPEPQWGDRLSARGKMESLYALYWKGSAGPEVGTVWGPVQFMWDDPDVLRRRLRVIERMDHLEMCQCCEGAR